MKLPKAQYQLGDPVNVRCEEAGQPPTFEAKVYGIRVTNQTSVEYTVIDTEGSISEGYTEDWLTPITPPRDHPDFFAKYVDFDPQSGATYINIPNLDRQVAQTRSFGDAIIIDTNAQGETIGVEILQIEAIIREAKIQALTKAVRSAAERLQGEPWFQSIGITDTLQLVVYVHSRPVNQKTLQDTLAPHRFEIQVLGKVSPA